MSCQNSAACWNSPSILPLGMRLTELKTRDTGSLSKYFADLQNENEFEIDSLNLNGAFSPFSSKQKPNDWHDCVIDEPSTKPNLLTKHLNKSTNPRVARIQEFVRKYNIDVSKKLKHNCQPSLPNPKTSCKFRNKAFHYYNLLRVSKEGDAEHPDIVKFRRFYNRHRPLSSSASKHEANFDFRPNIRLSPSLEEPKNFLGTRIRSPENQEYETCGFTPLVSVENRANSDNLLRVPRRKQNRVRFKRDCPTVVDLIKYNNSLANDSTLQRKPSSKDDHNLLYSPKMNCSLAGTGISAEKSSYFPDLQPGYSHNSPDLPENYFFPRKKASASCSYSSFDSTSDGSSLIPNKDHRATDFQRTYQRSSNLPESIHLSKSRASAPDSRTCPRVGNGNEIRTNCSPPRITDLESSCCQFSPDLWKENLADKNVALVPDSCFFKDRRNVTISANTSPLHFADSQNTFNRIGADVPENDTRTGNPTYYVRSHCEIENINSSTSHCVENGTPYIKYVESSASLYKYYHVPEKRSAIRNKANASSEKKTNFPIVNAPFSSNAPVEDGEIEVQSEKITFTGECIQAGNEDSESLDLDDSLCENPTTTKFPSSPDSFMKDISFSPDEDSDAEVPLNAVLNVRVVETSLYEIFSDNSCS